MRSLFRRLRHRLPISGGEHTDEHLLDEFLAHRPDVGMLPALAEDAFATIVRRHGPMVRGVCRRVLGNEADADDAFQAVFIVLLRKADTVRPRNRLGNWLYGVAVNVARRGRDSLARRRGLPLPADPPSPAPAVGWAAEQSELRTLIDQELTGLPDAYRAAVVAVDLEGNTRAEAAGRLGWSEGTVASRLARGRALLADRLTRRGVIVPAAGLFAALGPPADAVPVVNVHLLVSGPPPAAEALATEAMRAMTTSKWNLAVAVLATIGLAGAGAATVWACGGYGLHPRLTPPVSAAKPFPFESIPTTDAKPDDVPAAIERSAPTGMALAIGTDKPGGSGAGAAKPARFLLTNPARDITVVSDRHETFVEFFRRQPVLVAVVPAEVREKMLYDEKGPVGHVFVDSASFNVDGPRSAAYGASVQVASVALNGPVYGMLEMTPVQTAVVFVRDAANKELWHAVGFTTRSSVGFFAGTERIKSDDFAPADLIQTKGRDEKK
jgi:RNA polymerase sigma factor (sigma-70 family)